MEKLSQLVPKGVNDLHAEDFEIKEKMRNFEPY